jgi:hypothetical protein
MLPRMDDPDRRRAAPMTPMAKDWVHICECCGERMEERQCKIVCKNCGRIRDCSDP